MVAACRIRLSVWPICFSIRMSWFYRIAEVRLRNGGSSRCAGIGALTFHGSYLGNLLPTGVPVRTPDSPNRAVLVLHHTRRSGPANRSGRVCYTEFWAEGLTVFAFGTG